MRRFGIPSIVAFAVAIAAMGISQTSVFTDEIQDKEIPAKDLRMQTLKLSYANPGAASPHNIKLLVRAGQKTGAPEGFTVQWMTLDAYEANGNKWYDHDDPNLYYASFQGAEGGVSGKLNYNLGRDGTVVVTIGESLFDDAGATTNDTESLYYKTRYVFRAFAHGSEHLRPSFYSPLCTARTGSCPLECITKTQGFWKTHYPDDWPQEVLDNGMMLGNVLYTAQQLEDIFNTPAAGNGLISMSHQLIAAKLNIEEFGLPRDPVAAAAILATIADADALIGDLVVPPVGTGFLPPGDTSDLNDQLTHYNEFYDCG
jgi:hypothetical protein